jgi:UDP-2-acetamido-2,6-beta-L-arabino-hexul-4-ose reductase
MHTKSILITGTSGFVGRSLMNRLAVEGNYEVFTVDRNMKQIFPFTPKKISWVVHLASSHRETEEQMVHTKNAQINEALIKLLEREGLESNILFTSSVHEQADNYYGRSKKEGAIYLKSTCSTWGTKFEKIVFPNLFGPYVKPYHTSVVANFCNDIIAGKESYINNVEIKLLYIQDAIDAILNFESRSNFDSTCVYLPDLYAAIKKLHVAYYSDPLQIQLNSKFEVQLLSTLTSYY